jgi:hypothetical protein
VVVWTPATGKQSTWLAYTYCVAKEREAGLGGVLELALAGDQVAWKEFRDPVLPDTTLWAAKVGERSRRLVDSADVYAGGGRGTGQGLDELFGSSDDLIYSTYRFDLSTRRASANRYWRIINGTKRLAFVLPDTKRLPLTVGVDGGRIAISYVDRSVAIYSLRGRRLKTIPHVESGRGLAFQGEHVVGLQASRALPKQPAVGLLSVYDTRTGKHTQTIQVQTQPTPILRDLYGGLVVYTNGRKIHIVRLTDQAEAALVVPGLRVRAELNATGLFYCYSSTEHDGTIGFVPFQVIKDALR